MIATRAQIVNELEALSAHYPRPIRTPEEQSRFLADYIEDLANCSIEALRLGCSAWRRSDATKFPTPGQIRARVQDAEQAERKFSGDKVQVWRKPSRDEYDAMTLEEKRRQQLIMADEVMRDAGPMWSGGRPIPASEMPQSWHEKRAMQERHLAEAKRLAETIGSYAARRENAA